MIRKRLGHQKGKKNASLTKCMMGNIRGAHSHRSWATTNNDRREVRTTYFHPSLARAGGVTSGLPVWILHHGSPLVNPNRETPVVRLAARWRWELSDNRQMASRITIKTAMEWFTEVPGKATSKLSLLHSLVVYRVRWAGFSFRDYEWVFYDDMETV